ncbi:MAG: Resolvase helix-turn-helix protein [Leptospirillum sp. Group IV 'UBA BS']|nr:MAG: Resolvase helix-turn-helix protein [Leptospirillum sp. Group IV 'UBA BS']
MAGKRKGARMIREIQRLKSMGLGKRAVARTLGISRNTLRKYWEEATEGEGKDGPTTYQAPWSKRVDWEEVGKAVEKETGLGSPTGEELSGGIVPRRIPCGRSPT